MKALISGRAGKAIVFEGSSLWSLTIDDPHTLVARHLSDLPWLLGDATDLRILEDTDHEQVKQVIEHEYHCACALDVVLIALDPALSLPTRRDALVTAEQLLADPLVRQPLEYLLYGQPLPEVADVLGALQVCAISGATTVDTMLSTLNTLQPFIQAVHIAWDAIPEENFADDKARAEVHRLFIREGLFYDLARDLEAEAKANILSGELAFPRHTLSDVHMQAWSAQAKSTPSLRAIHNIDRLLPQWLRPFRSSVQGLVREDLRITRYVAKVAARVSTNVIGILGRQVRQAMSAPQQRHALERCYRMALSVWLPATDPLSQRYGPALETLWDEPAVIAELARLVQGRTPSQDTLMEYCGECTAGYDLPPFPMAARLADSAEAFRRAALQAPELMGCITLSLNHIVQVYQKGGGVGDEIAYRSALDRYLAWLIVSTGPLDDIYVPGAVEVWPETPQTVLPGLWEGVQQGGMTDSASMEPLAPAVSAKRLTMRGLLAQGDRVVVLGAPGCGKTMGLQYITRTLAEALRSNQPGLAAARLGVTGELPLPIPVPLSLYADFQRGDGADPEARQRQLVTSLHHYLQEQYADLSLPDDFFTTLLQQGRHVLLLLDGLDEVPNEATLLWLSQAMRDWIACHPHVRLVVTSRTQAYHGNAVLGGDFRVVRMLPLDAEHMAVLIRKAYQAMAAATPERDQGAPQAANLVASVLQLGEDWAAGFGSQDEPGLFTTPLLVLVLLRVYLDLPRLPAQRAERISRAAVHALLTSNYNPNKAVAQRLERLGGELQSRRDLLQYLAFYMHSRGPQAGREIGAQALTAALCAYLQQRQEISRDAAQDMVDDLVAVSRKRGGLLEEQAGQFRFGHLGFQKFLTARYLAEVRRDVNDMGTFLETRNRPDSSWWRDVIVLTDGYLHGTAPATAMDLRRRLRTVATL